MPKSFLKWVGGKQLMLPILRPWYPKRDALESGATYIEPFVGGGSVFFDLAPPRAVIGDVTPALTYTYEAMSRFGNDGWLNELRQLADKYAELPMPDGKTTETKESLYYAVREKWNYFGFGVTEFLFLNKTAHGGLWRLNSDGKMNAPWGKYPKPNICNEPVINACRDVLRTAQPLVVKGSYQESMRYATPGDFIYLDPPYDGTYDGYSRDGFTVIDQTLLALEANRCVELGATVVCTNSNTDLIQRLWKCLEVNGKPSFKIIPLAGSRAVTRDKSGRGWKGNDVLIVSRNHHALSRGAD
jgi:DNA adenine methylase